MTQGQIYLARGSLDLHWPCEWQVCLYVLQKGMLLARLCAVLSMRSCLLMYMCCLFILQRG
jgi:hypothetical protein